MLDLWEMIFKYFTLIYVLSSFHDSFQKQIKLRFKQSTNWMNIIK